MFSVCFSCFEAAWLAAFLFTARQTGAPLLTLVKFHGKKL